jgi:hypothetical protein
MADASLRHNTGNAHDPDSTAAYREPSMCDIQYFYLCLHSIASSHVQASGSISPATTPADLPLRQSLRRPRGDFEPKIHDVTEKFTRACKGMFPHCSLLLSRGIVGPFVQVFARACHFKITLHLRNQRTQLILPQALMSASLSRMSTLRSSSPSGPSK